MTPRDEIEEFIREQTGSMEKEDDNVDGEGGVFSNGFLTEMCFSAGYFAKKEEIQRLRNRLLQEFGVASPSGEMLVDILLGKSGLAIDPSGNILVADGNNNRVYGSSLL